MDKLFTLIRLGIKYLYRYRKRYVFLLIAMVFGFSLVTFITSVKDGMYENVYYAAQSHYAGDIVAAGYSYYSWRNQRYLNEDEISLILDAVKVTDINPKYTIKRTIRGNNAILFLMVQG